MPPGLVHLDFTANYMGPDGIRALAEAGLPPGLSRLDLSKSRIGSEGLRALAEAWRAGATPALQHLNLASNNLGKKEELPTLEEAEAEVDKARSESSEKHLKPYDRLAKTLKPPVVVPLRDQKCGGCHLKVSSGVDSEVRAKDENITCDNCRRLLYWEA